MHKFGEQAQFSLDDEIGGSEGELKTSCLLVQSIDYAMGISLHVNTKRMRGC